MNAWMDFVVCHYFGREFALTLLGVEPRLASADQKPLACSAFLFSRGGRQPTVDHHCGPLKPRLDQSHLGRLGPARELHLTEAGR